MVDLENRENVIPEDFQIRNVQHATNAGRSRLVGSRTDTSRTLNQRVHEALQATMFGNVSQSSNMLSSAHAKILPVGDFFVTNTFLEHNIRSFLNVSEQNPP
jgi:hypothetical protein